MKKIVISENEAGQRVDRFLRKYLGGAPLSAVYRIIRKDLKVNGRRSHEDTMLAPGDEMTLYLSDERIEAFAAPARRRPPAKKQFRVIYEDSQVLIVSKPAGLLVHGDASEKKNTLINQVLGYLQERGEYDPAAERIFSPAPVNRIDRNTSGLVIFGKTAPAVRELTKLIRQRDGIRKFYLAVACGQVTEEMVLRQSLVKDEEANRVRVTEPAHAKAGATKAQDAEAARAKAAAPAEGTAKSCDPGKPTPASPEHAKASETRVRPLKTGDRFSLIEAELITGRTHQIRVHMARTGHPLAGDPKYGDRRANEVCRKCGISSQLLHAWRLQFGELGQPLQDLSGRTIEAQPPKAFVRAAEELIDEQII